ncbi:SDR family NAD(P)-dependent oxidoreductase [Nocardioides fonticola]|uniref:SDR family NAD(P)-dependent oxidoreductase n=1 Tax=Nocardioides fonticola TaxID=450363 RepID=A0ABP7XFV0_9ACTN
MSARRVLITGGAGFIGTHLTRALLAQGSEVTVLDNLLPQVHGADRSDEDVVAALGGAAFVRGDVRDAEAWTRAYDGHDVIVHLAAETGTGQSMYEAARYTDVNVVGTARLLDLLTNTSHQVSRLVVASSRSIYGEGRYLDADGGVHYPGARRVEDLNAGRFEPLAADGTPLQATATDEDSRIHPSSVYGITKSTQEQLVLSIGEALGIPAVGLRYQNVFGPGQSLSNPYTGILSIFTTLLRSGAAINVFEDGRESRDFVFVSDVVEATRLAIGSDLPGSRVYNVGTGRAVDVLEVVRTLAATWGVEADYRVTGEYRLGDIRHNWADLTRIRADLGFTPQVDFAAGVAAFAEWARAEEAGTVGDYERSLGEMRSRGLMPGGGA